jgi:RNA polymerase sigma factor (sigma-70 family)
MSDALQTRPSLLVRIRDARDLDAWRRFAAIYEPLIRGQAHREGLQEADASDIAQEVMRTVAQVAPRFEYDASLGTFRGWLYIVTRNAIRAHQNRARKPDRGAGGTAAALMLAEVPADSDPEAAWEHEYQSRLFLWAAEQVRAEFEESSWRAFWATAIQGQGPKEVAAGLGISVGAVYIAKSRILARLRFVIRGIDGDPPPAES